MGLQTGITCMLIVLSVGHLSHQAIPNDPLWPDFANRLATESKGLFTMQDIKTKGTSDSTINELWTKYKAAKDTHTVPAASNLPDLPGVYDTAYMQGTQGAQDQKIADQIKQVQSLINAKKQSAGAQPAAAAQPAPSGSTTQNILDQIQKIQASLGGSSPSLMQQLSGNNPASNMVSQQGGSQAETINALLAQIKSNSESLASMQASTSTHANSMLSQLAGLGGAAGGDAYTDLLGGGAKSAMSQIGFNPSPSGFNSLMNMQNLLNAGHTGPSQSTATSPSSMEMNQLMLKYSQSLSGSAPAASSINFNDLLKQFNSQTPAQSSPAATAAPAPPSTTASPVKKSMEQQLQDFFPQFTLLGSGNNTEAMIIDAALFNPKTDAAGGKTQSTPIDALGSLLGSQGSLGGLGGSSSPASTAGGSGASGNILGLDLSSLGFGGPSAGGAGGAGAGTGSGTTAAPTTKAPLDFKKLLFDIWTVRASRKLNCRMLTETLDMDVMPLTSALIPMPCAGRCLMFPRIKSVQIGKFCVCCPPYVTKKMVDLFSFAKRPAYFMEPSMTIA